jgi:ribosomal RNA assembly protein
MSEINIPEERKAVLIGKEGKTKLAIERKARVKIKIMDCVVIEGELDCVLKAKSIVEAIGRGFSPKSAFRLLDEDVLLDMISLKGETEKTIKRLKGRVIGKDGISRKVIETESGARVSVYGKTISIIGTAEEIGLARVAIETLLKGKTHGYAFSLIEKK